MRNSSPKKESIKEERRERSLEYFPGELAGDVDSIASKINLQVLLRKLGRRVLLLIVTLYFRSADVNSDVVNSFSFL